MHMYRRCVLAVVATSVLGCVASEDVFSPNTMSSNASAETVAKTLREEAAELASCWQHACAEREVDPETNPRIDVGQRESCTEPVVAQAGRWVGKPRTGSYMCE